VLKSRIDAVFKLAVFARSRLPAKRPFRCVFKLGVWARLENALAKITLMVYILRLYVDCVKRRFLQINPSMVGFFSQTRSTTGLFFFSILAIN
jgi:hypothetical protein